MPEPVLVGGGEVAISLMCEVSRRLWMERRVVVRFDGEKDRRR